MIHALGKIATGVIFGLALIPVLGATGPEVPSPGTGIHDWPQQGRTIQRNMASDETGLPDSFAAGDDKTPAQNIKWKATLGNPAIGVPIIANGKIYISSVALGGDAKYPLSKSKLGALYCLDEKTGKMRWRFIGDKTKEMPEGLTTGQFGLITAPVVENDRLYILGGRLQVFCLTADGLAGKNVGPFVDEEKVYGIKDPFKLDETDADIVWMFDAKRAFPKIVYHNAYSFTPLVYGDYVYASTGNSAIKDQEYANTNHPPRDNADVPCFMALDKQTGALVAVDDEKMGRGMIHGQWGTPSVGLVNGKAQILFGGGNGVVYAFAPVSGPAPEGKAGVLTTIWSFDPNACLGAKRRFEIYGPPVCDRNRVYAALSDDWTHPKVGGILVCIDATQTGDITTTGKIWEYKDIGLSCGGVAIAHGRLYIGDLNGKLHCLDAVTGKPYWVYDLKSDIRAAAVVADGKVYIGTKSGEFFIFRDAETADLLFQTKLQGEISTPCSIANGCLYIVAGKNLYAVQK